MSLEYVRGYYKVPVKRGVRVTVDGQPGRVTSVKGCYLMVLFDGLKHPMPCHPTWRVTFHTADGDKAFGQDRLHAGQEVGKEVPNADD